MNSGMLNKNLLEKDIEYIKFYSNEEKNCLTNVCNDFNECSDIYKSKNMNSINGKINSLKEKIKFLYDKRISYTYVLNQAILRYEQTSQSIVGEFGDRNE